MPTYDHHTPPIPIHKKMAQEPTNSLFPLQPLLVITTMHRCPNPTKPQTMTRSLNGQSNKAHHLAHPMASPLYNLCLLQDIDTCLHLLSVCTNTTLNNNITTRHVPNEHHNLPTSEAPGMETQSLHGYTRAFAPRDHVNALPNSEKTSLSSPPPPRRISHATPPQTRAYKSLNSHSTKTEIPPLIPKGLGMPTFGGRTKRGQMVCNIHYPRIRHPRHTHEQHHQPL